MCFCFVDVVKYAWKMINCFLWKVIPFTIRDINDNIVCLFPLFFFFNFNSNKFSFFSNVERRLVSVCMSVEHCTLHDNKIYCASFYETVWCKYSLRSRYLSFLKNASFNGGTYLSLGYLKQREKHGTFNRS